MKTIVWFVFVLGALSAAGKVILTKPGQQAIIECGVSSFTNNLKWTHGSDLVFSVGRTGSIRRGTFDISKRYSPRQDTNLIISGVKEEDAGQITCVADGRHQEHTLLVVSVWASPPGELQLGSEATLQCQVKGLDSDSTLQWKRPDGSPHSGSQTVHIKSVTRSDAGTWQCTFSQGGEAFNQNLTVTVKELPPDGTSTPPFQNSDDAHQPSCPDCVSHPPPDAALLLGLSWWVWVAVGVGCLVVVLLMVCVIVLCKRIKRRKRKLQMMKNGRQPLRPKKYCQCDRPAAAAKPQQGRRREKPSAPPLQPLLIQ